MNLTTTQRFSHLTNQLFKNVRTRSNSLYVGVIVLALAALEIFNFSTTDFALRDILGNQGGGLLTWSMILALALCGMDIAGSRRSWHLQKRNLAIRPVGTCWGHGYLQLR